MRQYIDTSALTKLLVEEPETEALRAWLSHEVRELVSSDLTRTELVRSVRRIAPGRAVEAREALARVTLLSISTPVLEQAARLEPSTLRTLDAIHLASAMQLGEELEGMVCYDLRLANSARALGLAVWAPE